MLHQRQVELLSRTACRVAAVLLMLGAVTPALAADEATVTVDAARGGPKLRLALSTNLVTPGEMDSPGPKQLLSAWAPPLVRLHAGADTDGQPALPAGTQQGDWNFDPLDTLASAVREYGGEPVMNVRYAPTWMWTCSEPFSSGQASSGVLRDQTYQQFAEYVARLVGWYNAGGFTDESGAYHASGHQGWIRNWEIWNEPDLSDETPCRAPDGGPALSPQQYVAMWNVVVPRMLRVDPGIRVIGPAVSRAEPAYVAALLGGAQRAPDIISCHAYGGGENGQPDRALFDGLRELADCMALGGRTPVWITELNLNSAYGEDPAGRPSGAMGIAWGASAFRTLALGGADLVHQYEFSSTPQFGLVDQRTGAPLLPYWRDLLLSRAFPPGSELVETTSAGDGVEALAARRADGSLTVLIVNRRVANNNDIGGKGVPIRVTLQLRNSPAGPTRLRVFDRSTLPAIEPGPSAILLGDTSVVTLDGYGMALLEIAAAP